MNKYSPKQFNPKSHTKRRSISDFARLDNQDLNQKILIAGSVAVLMVVFFVTASFDQQAWSQSALWNGATLDWPKAVMSGGLDIAGVLEVK